MRPVGKRGARRWRRAWALLAAWALVLTAVLGADDGTAGRILVSQGSDRAWTLELTLPPDLAAAFAADASGPRAPAAEDPAWTRALAAGARRFLAVASAEGPVRLGDPQVVPGTPVRVRFPPLHLPRPFSFIEVAQLPTPLLPQPLPVFVERRGARLQATTSAGGLRQTVYAEPTLGDLLALVVATVRRIAVHLLPVDPGLTLVLVASLVALGATLGPVVRRP